MSQRFFSLADSFSIKDEQDRVVATVSKRWFSFTDTYGIEVADGEDPVLILASAVVVDMVCHSDNRRR